MAQKNNQKSTAPERTFENFDRNNFERSTNIDNKWLPLKPGTQYVYTGFTQEDKKRVPHRVVMTVTDLTKVIDGVRTVVVWERDYKAGKLLESELVFFAQDKEGNVWHLGQYVETYDDVEFVGGKVWLSGMEGARAGIMMKADPRPGTPSYSQGYAPPPFNWTDRGKVDKVGQKTCVRTGCYEHVLVIAESSEEEGPDAEQLKYYAPGVGYVRVGWRGKGEKLRETLELVEVVKLDPEALAKVRAEALELEKRASVYGRTPPAEIMPAWPASDKSDSLGPQVRAGRGHAMGQRGFFDVERRLDGISAKGDPLETIKLLLANSGMRACRASLGRVIFLVVPSMGGWSALPFFPP